MIPLASITTQEGLVRLGRHLREHGYTFVTSSPATHRRVDARFAALEKPRPRTLRDVFGFSRYFAEGDLPDDVMDAAQQADVITIDGNGYRSTVRFSTLGDDIFAHSAYPTVREDAVFFGPDTYRFCDLITAELAGTERASYAVDIGCGSGAGGLIASRYVHEVVLADINPVAIRFANVNILVAKRPNKITSVVSDLLKGIERQPDLVLANPPFMADPAGRAYRNGGGAYGEELGVSIAREAALRLESGGRLILYTGSAIVDGEDTFLRAVKSALGDEMTFRYRELDPDVFGEEIEANDAYASVERIAAVALVGRKR